MFCWTACPYSKHELCLLHDQVCTTYTVHSSWYNKRTKTLSGIEHHEHDIWMVRQEDKIAFILKQKISIFTTNYHLGTYHSLGTTQMAD
jgi:hypothetical protein